MKNPLANANAKRPQLLNAASNEQALNKPLEKVPMSNLKQQIQEDMKSAMRAKDSERLKVIRMLMAAIKQNEIDNKTTLDDAQVLSVIDKMIKQRRDSYEQFKAGQREDLANKEKFEITILQSYLPKPLSEQEIEDLIATAIKVADAKSMQDMGKVMAIIKLKAQGRADIGKISAKVKALLAAT